MHFLGEIGRFFEPPDIKAVADFARARALIAPSERAVRMGKIMLEGNFRFSKELWGSNGSPRILHESETQTPVVIKTYEPIMDTVHDYPIENNDRVEMLREEAAAYLVAEAFPLVAVPHTVLRKVTPEVLKNWNVKPKVYSSAAPALHEQAVMLQEYIGNGGVFSSSGRRLPELASQPAVFGLLTYDYLIAYGDGRSDNLLISPDTIWAVDHGKSFRFLGTIRGTESLGIPENYSLEDTETLLASLKPERSKPLLLALEIMLGKEKARAFGERYGKLYTALSQNRQITIGEFRHSLSYWELMTDFPRQTVS